MRRARRGRARRARFGAAVAVGSDWDGNGEAELLVGAPADGGEGAGALHVLLMSEGARYYDHRTVSAASGVDAASGLGASLGVAIGTQAQQA